MRSREMEYMREWLEEVEQEGIHLRTSETFEGIKLIIRYLLASGEE